ncbi:hypothetical protein LIBO111022_00275 [Listeria booriae]|nr:Uncharacterised protein [Listeria booriae]
MIYQKRLLQQAFLYERSGDNEVCKITNETIST